MCQALAERLSQLESAFDEARVNTDRWTQWDLKLKDTHTKQCELVEVTQGLREGLDRHDHALLEQARQLRDVETQCQNMSSDARRLAEELVRHGIGTTERPLSSRLDAVDRFNRDLNARVQNLRAEVLANRTSLDIGFQDTSDTTLKQQGRLDELAQLVAHEVESLREVERHTAHEFEGSLRSLAQAQDSTKRHLQTVEEVVVRVAQFTGAAAALRRLLHGLEGGAQAALGSPFEQSEASQPDSGMTLSRPSTPGMESPMPSRPQSAVSAGQRHCFHEIPSPVLESTPVRPRPKTPTGPRPSRPLQQRAQASERTYSSQVSQDDALGYLRPARRPLSARSSRSTQKC